MLEQAGIFIGTGVREGRIHLDGKVDSLANRDAALDVARAIAEPLGLTIQVNIEIVSIVPDTVWPETAQLEPDFSNVPGTIDPEVADEGVPYFPPADPVVAPSNDDHELEVVGGFQFTSKHEDPTDQHRGSLGDGQLQDIIQRELREGALTIDLQVEVDVRNSVATLRGEVERLEDDENAEAVAARVEGVQEVREELVVRSITRRPAPE